MLLKVRSSILAAVSMLILLVRLLCSGWSMVICSGMTVRCLPTFLRIHWLRSLICCLHRGRNHFRLSLVLAPKYLLEHRVVWIEVLVTSFLLYEFTFRLFKSWLVLRCCLVRLLGLLLLLLLSLLPLAMCMLLLFRWLDYLYHGVKRLFWKRWLRLILVGNGAHCENLLSRSFFLVFLTATANLLHCLTHGSGLLIFLAFLKSCQIPFLCVSQRHTQTDRVIKLIENLQFEVFDFTRGCATSSDFTPIWLTCAGVWKQRIEFCKCLSVCKLFSSIAREGFATDRNLNVVAKVRLKVVPLRLWVLMGGVHTQIGHNRR